MDAYRPLFRGEAHQYQEHLLRLDPDSRLSRFASHVSDAIIEQYCAAINWETKKIIGYFVDGIMRGAVEIIYESISSPSSAELAFSVEKPFQNARIGSRLMARSMISLRNQGVTRIHVVCLPSNLRMRNIATHYPTDVSISYDDVVMTISTRSGYTPLAIQELADSLAETMYDHA